MQSSNFILLIIMLIILTPIPIKFSVFYENKVLNVKLYNFSIISKSTNTTDRNLESKFINILNKKQNKKFNLNYKRFLKNFSLNLTKYNLKLPIKLLGNLNYSLGDAYRTAIMYGGLSSILAFLYRYMSSIFNFSNSNFSINPSFKDYSFVTVNFKCILYVSFGKIIYMMILILKSLINSREVNPVKGDL